MDQIQIAQQQFGELIKSELERIERMKLDTEIKDFSKLDTITVGILPGDGVGPILMKQALRVLENLMAPEIASGRLVIRQIEGMTIERRADLMQSLPDDVFQACKECDVLVKGPMVTPREGDPWPNLVSANSLLRRGLDLFAAVRGKEVFLKHPRRKAPVRLLISLSTGTVYRHPHRTPCGSARSRPLSRMRSAA